MPLYPFDTRTLWASRQVLVFSLTIVLVFVFSLPALAQGTRLLRQPDLSATHVTFIYGGDLWIADRNDGGARRLTSTPAVESDPHFSPDGRWIAFTSNRSGQFDVYIVSTDGGEPTRLTWYPAESRVRGWTSDGRRVLYASSRETAPTSYDRLWTVSVEGGPSTLLPAPWGARGAFDADGKRIVVDRVARWDEEWRSYRGGQNTPLVILDLQNLNEVFLPNERTTDTQPVWMGDTIYFLSDRDWTTNIWAYSPSSGALEQRTKFTGSDVKSLAAGPDLLIFEREGYLHTFDPASGETRSLEITVRGDFPWAQERWENVSNRVSAASLSPTGKRAVMEARGEIFTIPVEYGDARNLTRSAGAADRRPIWSPDGRQVAWFSDTGGNGYALLIGAQDGLSKPRRIDIGESKMAWEPAWSPDGHHIAFVDDDVRVRVVDVKSGKIKTVDVGGTNLERGSMGPGRSPDSRWLAYARTAPNGFRRITVWSREQDKTFPLTDPLADAFAPQWDHGSRHLYFLASTDKALGSGWANTSAMQANPEYGAYLIVLRQEDPSPFPPRSDEEQDTTTADTEKKEEPEEKAPADTARVQPEEVRIDLDRLDRRTVALPMPVRRYRMMLSGPKGSVFLGEQVPNSPGLLLHKFTVEGRKSEEFVRGVSGTTISADGEKMLYQSGGNWRVADTASPPTDGGKALSVVLRMQLDQLAEWKQIFDEAWRYERDYFYDPGMHGRDWNEVRERYAPLIPYVRHRADLSYVLDQVNAELSVGHSFVFGGAYPAVDTSRVGLLGADLTAENGHWRITRIFTAESWNPDLKAPLDRPGLRVKEGDYLLAVDGVELTAGDDPYRLLDGTADRQTILHINDRPSMDGAWKEVVEPIQSE